MKGLMKCANSQPTWSKAVLDGPLPSNHEERVTSVARELGGLAGGAGTGALAGLAIGGPMGAGPGATIGGLGGLIGGSILGSKKILEDRHARGEPLYGEREDDLKAQAISNPNQTNYYGSE